MDAHVSLLYSWEIILWTEATRGRVGVCVARLSRHLRYDLPDWSGVLFLKAIKAYIGSARCSSRTLTLINMVALSPANTEANLSSTTTTATECSVQAGRSVGSNNRPNGERGVRPLHNKSFVLRDKLGSWNFRFVCDMGVFTRSYVLVTGILIFVTVILRTAWHLAYCFLLTAHFRPYTKCSPHTCIVTHQTLYSQYTQDLPLNNPLFCFHGVWLLFLSRGIAQYSLTRFLHLGKCQGWSWRDRVIFLIAYRAL
jgi:hypothetical protein